MHKWGCVCVIWYVRVLQWPGCSSFSLRSVFPETCNAKTWHCSKEHFHHFAPSITIILMSPRTIKGKDKSMALGETSKICIFYWKHGYRLIKPLNTTRNVPRNWRASFAGKCQVWLLLLFPSLLQGLWKVPPWFLNIDLVILHDSFVTRTGWFQTATAQHNTGQVPALLRALSEVTTHGDTAQEPESLSLKHNQKRSSQSCCKLDDDVGK